MWAAWSIISGGRGGLAVSSVVGDWVVIKAVEKTPHSFSSTHFCLRNEIGNGNEDWKRKLFQRI